MKTFRYAGFDRGGQRQAGLIEAEDPKDARARLADSGVYAERIDGVERGTRGGRAPGMGHETRAVLYRELATLVRAGQPLLTAFQTVSPMPEFQRVAVCLAAIRDRIREGAGLGDAVARADPTLWPFERAALDAGERAGQVAPSLDRLADYLLEQQELRSRVRAALVYPAAVLVFAALTAAVMLGFVLPHSLSMIQRTGVTLELPGVTRFMLALRGVAAWLVPALGLAALLAAGVGRRRLRLDPRFRLAWDRFRFRLPVVGAGYRLLVNLRFARTLAMVLRGGVSAEEGLALAGRASGSPWVEQRSGEEGEAVRHGSALSDAVARIAPLAPHLPSWIQTGEAAGAVAEMLDHAAARLQRQWNQRLARVLSLLEPALIVLVGGMVFAVVLAIVLPLLRLNQGLLT